MLALSTAILLVPALLILYTPVKAAPNPRDWSALNRTLGGRLQAATPLALPCFSQYNGLATQEQVASCAAVQASYTSATYRQDHFASYMNAQDEECAPDLNQQCLLDPISPANSQAYTNVSCNQGAIPPHYIEVQGPGDVQAAFAFAASTGTPISIKNTGHDYNGRSSGPGSLALWTHGLQNLTYHASFLPSGCPSHQKGIQAITTGAGVDFNTVYKFADQNNVTIIAGSAPTVGVSGGWVQGGGHSVLSPAYGLGIDRVLEFTLVAPDGAYYVANSCTNPELFWALRGGGGSTFGVVLSTTHRVEPVLSLSVAFISLPSTASQSVQSGFLDLIVNGTLDFTSQGWGGFLSPGLLLLATPLLSLPEAQVSLSQFANYATANNGFSIIESLPTWYAFYSKYIAPSAQPVGSVSFSNNRLIPASLFASVDGRKKVREYMDWLRSVGLEPQILSTAPYLYSGNGNSTLATSTGNVIPKPYAYGAASSTSSTPAWRDTALLISAAAGWAYNATLQEKLQLVMLLKEVDSRATALTPGGGAYINEASPWTSDWKDAFWGANYERLEQLKNKWDPEELLGCWHCVGDGGNVRGAIGGKCLGKLGDL